MSTKRPATAGSITLDAVHSEQLAALVDLYGVTAVSRRTGLPIPAIDRGIARLPIRRGTALLIERALARCDRPEPLALSSRGERVA